MNITTIVIIIAVIAVIAVVASRGGGPRVTEITRTRKREKDRGDA